ncbi:sorbosone dehydrogenase family protein [Klenkia sp. PcliD-1-E]|uniref:PQQ-dependent sugar dehydrogenase n=1 Tax=Klenkia sp. PcliD-1-E TaxID=2954492 RepID=UPI002097CA23|nr:PQQ-dependent sugar dehydrogenase [Klenkia sp. PcliD-1-E]MCO7219091.1 PQQ-dependent sugar dehydrogenase [Klenkia sp. PcliD-1-E]
MTRGARALVAAAACALLAGCGGGYTPAGPFRAVQDAPGPQVGPPTDSAPSPAPGSPTPGTGQEEQGDPNVLATDLAVPTGLVLLPDGTGVVGERETGRLLQVFPDRSPARELMVVPGVDTTGDGGLLGLALSPTYDQDGLFYAYLSTATDNRVVRFPLGGTPNPVVTGIPRGETHNGGGLVFGPDGTLYVGTGDTGDADLAQDRSSLAGKVLAYDVFGQPVGDGPLYSSGLSDVKGLCLGPDGSVYATDDAATGPDEFNRLVPGGDYGAPRALPGSNPPVLSVPGGTGGLAGCAVSGSFVFLGALEGRQVVLATLGPDGAPVEEPEPFLADEYGRLRTVVVDPEGALWITTSNTDGIGSPAEDDDKVLRIQPPASDATSPL